MKNIIAVDVGFGRVKALTEQHRLEYPSVTGPWCKVRFSNNISSSLPVERLAVEYVGQKIFIGEMAYRQSKARVSMSMDRFCSAEGMSLMLSSIALLLPGREISCRLITGLPVNAYASLKEKYERILLGRHYIKLLDINGKPDERYINITGCKVLPQPMGTVFNAILNEKGELSNRELASSRLAVLDVGQYTLDLVRVDSLEFIDAGSTSYSDLGVFSCYQQLSLELYNNFEIEIPPEEIEPYVAGGTIKIGGCSRSILDIKTKVYQAAAEKIVSRVRNFWGSMWRLDRIIVAGGGAQVFGTEIVRALDSPGQVEVSTEGTLSNVLGYHKFGNRTWTR